MIRNRKTSTKKKKTARTVIDLERCLTMFSYKLTLEGNREVW